MTKQSDSGSGRRASDKGRYGRLSRERVLATALDLVDDEGLSALSMRRVGSMLGVEAMALYRYASSKDALLDGLVETLYIELGDALAAGPDGPEPKEAHPSRARPRWRSELHRLANATYQVTMAHPNVAPLLATRMMMVPLTRRPSAVLQDSERLVALLSDAGLDERDTAIVYRAVTAWVLGYTLTELRATVDDPDETDPAFRLGLHHMSAQEFPRLRAVTPALAEHGGPEGLADGLDALLDHFIPRPPVAVPEDEDCSQATTAEMADKRSEIH
ncbi:TetR/AcrR family transcriptional regulator [Streptacidiphilus sp. EB129]|uniref:TetR/AcrR family transcriptional regulator n=1 Tax=Streptacidiphilus sp. EB129 TaxID=3156262 RepID=UPI003516EA8F